MLNIPSSFPQGSIISKERPPNITLILRENIINHNENNIGSMTLP